jgi:hypothetical protein
LVAVGGETDNRYAGRRRHERERDAAAQRPAMGRRVREYPGRSATRLRRCRLVRSSRTTDRNPLWPRSPYRRRWLLPLRARQGRTRPSTRGGAARQETAKTGDLRPDTMLAGRRPDHQTRVSASATTRTR